MQRVTISIDDELAQAFDALVVEQGYQSKSEAIRDLVRHAVESRRNDSATEGLCVASLSYVYDHHVRALAQRLVEIQHDHHDLVVATMHVHIDPESCLETTILKGQTTLVRHLADSIQSQRGVRFAELNLIRQGTPRHHHHHGPHGHDHTEAT